MKRAKNRRRRGAAASGSRGASYVAVLVLVTALSATALAFVNRVGLQTGSAHQEWEQTQADYLAHAAINHAMWRLLHDPVFVATADPNKYTMHDYNFHNVLGGRYGYMVRPHTDHTFATIAAIGIFGDCIAERRHVICIDD
ncbi:MAG: hypothetical protein JW958_10545 [Candidatus Eisenbacteria bacterium]|nr:hypothetical protein [Candidatus Eisenbacteria bacterium]